MKNDKDNTLGSMSDSIHRMVDILDKMGKFLIKYKYTKCTYIKKI